MPNGKKLSFRLFGRSDSATSKQSVQFVAGWLQDVGIDVKTKIVSEDALTEIIGQGNFDMFEWGWVVEPDPELPALDLHLREPLVPGRREHLREPVGLVLLRPGLRRSSYAKQSTQIDTAQRAATVKQMQKMVYDAAPYVVTVYYDNLEAYRSDQLTGFRPQPEPNGSLLFQYGTYSYQSVRPVTAKDTNGSSGGAAAAASSESSSNAPMIAIGVVVLVALGVGGFVLARRRRPEHDVE